MSLHPGLQQRLGGFSSWLCPAAPLATGKESADKANPCPQGCAGTSRGSTAVHREHVPHPSSPQRMLCWEWTQSPGSWNKLPTEPSQEPRVLIHNIVFFFLLFKWCLFHVWWSHGPCHSCSAPSAPRAVGRGRFSLRGAFCFHDHTNCNKLYKKTLASPKVWQQPFSVWAEGTRLCHPLLLHHTCPSASSPSAPGAFGPFSQAAFSTVFFTPVLLAASCQTANKSH